MWDTGEAQTVPYLFGIAHRTGFPLYVLIGWVFSHTVAFGNVAWRMSLMSAVTMSVAAGCLYLSARSLGLPPLVALGTTCVFAFTELVWTRASRAEVHSLAMMWAAIGYTAALRWARNGRARDAYVLAASIGCGLATHPIELMLAPGLAVLTAERWRALTPRSAVTLAALIGVPILAYAYIPLRSAYVVAHGLEPTAVLGLVGQPIWNYDNPSTPAKFFSYLASMGGPVGDGLSGMLTPERWVRVANDYGPTLLAQFGAVALALAAVGLTIGARERFLTTFGLVLSAFLPVVFVLNFDESDADRYFLASYWVVTLLVGYGTFRLISGYVRKRVLPATLGASLILFALSGWLFHANAHLFSQRYDRGGEDFIGQIRRLTPDDAIVVATWLTAPTLAYAADVQHSLGHRLVVTAGAGQYATHYTGWLKKRPLYVRSETPFTLPQQRNLQVTVTNAVSELYRITIRGERQGAPRIVPPAG